MSGFTPQEVGLGLYAALGVAFTILPVLRGPTSSGSASSAAWSHRCGTGASALAYLLVLLAVLLHRSGDPRPLPAAPIRRSDAFVPSCVSILFRAEAKWRIEAAELIDALPAFDDLPVEVLNDLAGRVNLRGIRPGQPVFRQGDRPTAFYVVRRGQVADRGGSIRTPATCGCSARSSEATRSERWGSWTQRLAGQPLGLSTRWSCSRSTRERSTVSSPIRSRRRTSDRRCKRWPSCVDLPPFAGLEIRRARETPGPRALGIMASRNAARHRRRAVRPCSA